MANKTDWVAPGRAGKNQTPWRQEGGSLSLSFLFLLPVQGPASFSGSWLLGLVSVFRLVRTVSSILQVSQRRLCELKSHTGGPYRGSQEYAQPVS